MGWLSKTLYAAGAAAGVYAGVSALMARGLTRTARIRPEETPATVGLPYETVAFPSRAGEVTLSGWLCPPPGCTDMNDALAQRWIVLAHGFGSNGADPTTGMLGLARDLHDRNFGVLLFDCRASGNSEGSWSSAGYFERFDLLGALDYMADRGVARERLGVLGHSMGGAIALMACSTPGTAAAVVSDSAFADLWLMIKRAQKGVLKPLSVANPGMGLMARLLFGVEISEVSPARSLALSETPVLIVHGEEDRVVPLSHARLLAKASGSQFRTQEGASARVWIVEGAGHLDAYRKRPSEYVGRVADFFDAHLGAGVRSGIAG